ncbi:hypothetical protein C8R43DRAFT_942208 [Mycena crocata]|nr:hypothetical protein C8R43DRAFT_942208 [Mycena crocata]
MDFALPDHVARTEYVALLRNIGDMIEKSEVETKARLAAIRDRYSLDDDGLAFEADVQITGESVSWEAERDVLKEELARVRRFIEFAETYRMRARCWARSREEIRAKARRREGMHEKVRRGVRAKTFARWHEEIDARAG